MPSRSIALVSHYTPPSHASAARRPAGLVKELGRLGHRVTVVTSVMPGSGPVPGATRTLRTRDLLRSNLNWRRGNVEALASEGAAVDVAPPSFIEGWIPPDLQAIAWLPFALPRVAALDVDCVITTGPPHSTHLAGAALAARGVPWIAELQDGWTFEAGVLKPFPGPLATLNGAIERFALGRSDARVGISAPIADDLRARFGGRAEYLPLAYDPDEMAEADAIAAQGPDELLDPGKHSLVYTGSVISLGSAPFTFLEGLAQLRAARPDADRLEVVVAGPVLTAFRARAAELGLDGVVRFVGSLGRARALALQRRADSLLVLAPEERASVLTNKLIEYLVAARPLLVLGAGTEAAKVTEAHGAGLVVDPRDAPGTAAALGRLLDGAVTVDAAGAQEYAYPAVAARMAALVEDVIAARGR